MPPDWKDGDDVDPGKAKEHVKRLLEDPRHKRAKGSAEDEATRDDPVEQGDED